MLLTSLLQTQQLFTLTNDFVSVTHKNYVNH